MFQKVDPKQSISKLEEQTLKYWEKNQLFEKSVEFRPADNEYVFYDGPPFATGSPHFGTLLASIIKDVIPRYKTMQGYRVARRFGWDCHGLPVETLVEKEIGIRSKKELEEYGIEKFNNACEAAVLRFVDEWADLIKRVGRWVDLENNYKTMDLNYMESILWVFKQMHERELVYKGFRTSFYCTRCETPLSNFEISMDNSYEDLQDPSVTVKFELTSRNDGIGVEADSKTFLLAWTTTPWTLVSNAAVAVGPEITYVQVRVGSEKFILAKDRLEAFTKELTDYEILTEFSGKELEGLTYNPLFPYYDDKKNAFRVVVADFVSIEDGTGAVHIAPSYGEDDFNVGKKEKLPLEMQPLKPDGTFSGGIKAYAGMHLRDANKEIIKDLKEQGSLFQQKTIQHSYPICWRCDTPLIYMVQEAWFVKVSEIKDKALALNEKINWSPDHLKHGRFGKGLESAPDWNITRNRFWGAPIPIWLCDSEECDEQEVFGSLAEIEKASGTKVTNLHRPHIDKVTFPCKKCKGTMHRTEEVLDCWFESGSMPYAVAHYPFENKDWFESHFPADFIAEYIAQTRGWFYNLHVLSTSLFGKPAFKNALTTGVLLGTDGHKLSKSRGNYTDPDIVLQKFGADAVRYYLMAGPVMRAENVLFTDEGVEDAFRSIILPIWNSYSFFVTYANIDKWEPGKKRVKKNNKLDQWILSELNGMIQEVETQMDAYDTVSACVPVREFTDKLTNWYIRRSRRRFWKSEDDSDKQEAYDTLHEVLVKLSQAMAPITPFISEEIYRNLTNEESVHLSNWPKVDKKAIDDKLNKEMHTLQLVVKLGLAARANARVKVRQPLSRIDVATNKDEATIVTKNKAIVLAELNVKKLNVLEDLPKEVTVTLLPDARILGPKFGKEMKAILTSAKSGSFTETKDGYVVTDKDDFSKTWELSGEEAELRYDSEEGKAVEAESGMVVALETEVTPELAAEGLARDIVRSLQDLRKEAGYEVDNRITIKVETEAKEVQEAVKQFADYIKEETLADDLVITLDTPDTEAGVTIEGHKVQLAVKK